MAKPVKEPTDYQKQMQEKVQKEFSCGILHDSIEEAIVHAELELGMRDATGKTIPPVSPYVGTMKFGSGVVVGWEKSKRVRYRLDFDPDYLPKNEEAAKNKDGVNKGTQGVHVNEENFDRATRQKICHATTASLLRADTYWSKWSKAFGQRGLIDRENLK